MNDAGGDRRHGLAGWILGAAATIALAAAAVSSGTGTMHVSTDARTDNASPTEIVEGIDDLKPNCRMIARHRLRARLDGVVRTGLTKADLAAVLDPLRRGGSDLCDDIVGQSFALGGS